MIRCQGSVGLTMVWYPDCDTRSANAARAPLHVCRGEATGRSNCLHGELHCVPRNLDTQSAHP